MLLVYYMGAQRSCECPETVFAVMDLMRMNKVKTETFQYRGTGDQ